MMSILPLLVLVLIGSSASVSPVYTYNLTLTLINGGQPLSPDEYGGAYFYLLNQNIFPNSSFQSVELTRITLNGIGAGYSLTYDSDGNPIVTINTNGSLGPNQNATVFMSFRATLNKTQLNLTSPGNLSSIPVELKQAYPLTGSFNISEIPNSQEIVETALSIKGDEENVLAILLNLARWFEDNMVYSSNLSIPQDVSQTFATKSGDCDDQANLFVTFCRIIGIPAYTTIGPIYIPGLTIESEGNLRFNLTNAAWHGWVMAYLPGSGGQWVPVDLTFFRGAVLINEHVHSTDAMQHITGSALAYWDTLEYAYVKNLDYVSSAVQSKENITSSDIVWVEQHSMAMEGQQQTNFPAFDDPFSVLMFVVAIFALLVFVITYLRRRSRGAGPPLTISLWFFVAPRLARPPVSALPASPLVAR